MSARALKESDSEVTVPTEAGCCVIHSSILCRLHAQWSLPARAACLGWSFHSLQMSPSTLT